ncbi:type IV pilus assembly protein PilM [Petroclostridium xylanilyticum]|uniref:type IV pilus assembly protein PilM n=1 Tax=Petroclostridium xylanilyticum TaxID=1792311 RepID=UPI000B99D1D9|nr:type IV pilus assembly protein PilM [Petroclostridium xylanilyticum]
MLFPKFIALDIGTCNTKMIQAMVIGSKINVDKFAMFPTPQYSIDDGRIMDADMLAEQIKKHLESNRMRAKNAIITISGTSIITREIILPRANGREFKAMVDMEAPQYFPVDMDNYILDYKVLEEIKNGKGAQYRTILVAVPANIIQGYIQLMEKCGLHIYAIDFVGNSIVKLMRNEMMQRCNKKSKEGKNSDIKELANTEDTVAVVDIGCKTTTVTILSKGILKFNRILLYGSENFSTLIANNLGITFEEAERKKQRKGRIILSDEQQQDAEMVAISEGIRSVLLGFIDDIGHFFDFYNSRNTGNRIDKIYLTGGGSMVRDISEYLENALNIKTERIIEFENVNYPRQDGTFQEIQVYFANCLGAVLNK